MFTDDLTISEASPFTGSDPGEAKITAFRHQVLTRFLYIASGLSLIVLPAYWVIGLTGLTVASCVFFLCAFVLCYLHNLRQVAREFCAHSLIALSILIVWAGIYYGNELIDNKPWQMLIPMIAYLVAGSRRGTWWSCLHLAGLPLLFYLRRSSYEAMSVAILLLAYPTLAYAMYVFARSNEENIRTISRLSHTDSLTKTYNRQLFDELFVNMFNRARRANEALAVYMIDIDHFKKFNDNYGHISGDRALMQVADVIRRSARRASDLVFRYGGEEFCVVSSGLSGADARSIAESIIAGVRALQAPHSEGENGRLTVSIGLAYVSVLEGSSTEGLLRLADQALYCAKSQGRDRIEVDAGKATNVTELAAAR